MLRPDEIHRLRQQLLGLVVGKQASLAKISGESGFSKAELQAFLAGEAISSERALNLHAYLFERGKIIEDKDARSGDPHAVQSLRQRFEFLAAEMTRLGTKKKPQPVYVWLRKLPNVQRDIVASMENQCKLAFIVKHGERCKELRLRLPDGMSYRLWLTRFKEATSASKTRNTA